MRTFILAAILLGILGLGFVYFNMQEESPLGALINPQQENNMSGQFVAPSDGAAASSTGAYGTNASLGVDTIYFKITSVDYAGGQTMPSAQFEGTSSGLGGLLVTFTPVTGTYQSRLWVATTSGSYFGYMIATSSTLVSTTSATGLTAGSLPQTNTAYVFNSGSEDPNSWLWSYAIADTLVKSGPTFVHTVTYSPSDAAATAGYIAILNATAAGNNATTTLYSPPAAAIAPVTVVLDQIFDTGLYIDFTTTADVNVSVSYK